MITIGANVHPASTGTAALHRVGTNTSLQLWQSRADLVTRSPGKIGADGPACSLNWLRCSRRPGAWRAAERGPGRRAPVRRIGRPGPPVAAGRLPPLRAAHPSRPHLPGGVRRIRAVVGAGRVRGGLAPARRARSSSAGRCRSRTSWRRTWRRTSRRVAGARAALVPSQASRARNGAAGSTRRGCSQRRWPVVSN